MKGENKSSMLLRTFLQTMLQQNFLNELDAKGEQN